MITVYVKKGCPYSHRVCIALEEKKVLFKLLEFGKHFFIKDLLKLNSYGLLPIIKDKENIIYDPEIILLYIDERYPTPPLLPHYPVDRARIRLAMIRIDREWYTILNFIMKTNNTEKINEAKKALLDSFQSLKFVFLENTFFMSENFSLADCSLAAFFYLLLPYYNIFLDNLLFEIYTYILRIFSLNSFQKTLFYW